MNSALGFIFVIMIVLVVMLRPRASVRLIPSRAQPGCSEFTLLVSYNSLRAMRENGRFRIHSQRRHVLLAGYNWNEPRA